MIPANKSLSHGVANSLKSQIGVFSIDNGAGRYRSVVSSSFRQGPVNFAHQQRILRPTVIVLIKPRISGLMYCVIPASEPGSRALTSGCWIKSGMTNKKFVVDAVFTPWCNWQHPSFWYLYSRFESWRGSFLIDN